MSQVKVTIQECEPVASRQHIPSPKLGWIFNKLLWNQKKMAERKAEKLADSPRKGNKLFEKSRVVQLTLS